GDSRQFHWRTAGRIDDQAADALHRIAVRFRRAYEHVDLAVAEAVAGGDVAAHLLDHHVGDLARGQAQRRGAFLVEHDLDLGKALLHRRLHVGVVGIAAQHRRHLAPGLLQGFQVLALDLELPRRRQAEQLRAGEAHLCFGVALHARAQLFGFTRLELTTATAFHHHGELADVLAARRRAGVQARTGAADAVQRADAFVAG